jgi:TolB protein
VLVYASVRSIEGGDPSVPGVFADLFTVRADGSGLRRLTRTRAWEQDPAWSPNGRLLAYSRGQAFCHAGSCDWGAMAAGISVMAADGRQARELTSLGEAIDDFRTDESPSWSPDSKRIAFTRTVDDETDPANGIYVIGVDGEGLRRISPAPARSLAWSPDGSTIAYVHKSGGYVGLLDVATRRARRLRSGLAGHSSVDWSPRGQFLAIATGRAVFVVRSTGGVARRVVEARGADGVSWAPDGCCLVFSALPAGTNARADLYTVSVRGGRQRRLTRNRGPDLGPDWWR